MVVDECADVVQQPDAIGESRYGRGLSNGLAGVDVRGDHRGEIAQGVAVVVGERFAWMGIHHEERAEDASVGPAQWGAGVEAHVRLADDQRMLDQPGIALGVEDAEHAFVRECIVVERQVAAEGGGTDAGGRFDLDVAGGDDGDRREAGGHQLRSETGNALDGRFGAIIRRGAEPSARSAHPVVVRSCRPHRRTSIVAGTRRTKAKSRPTGDPAQGLN